MVVESRIRGNVGTVTEILITNKVIIEEGSVELCNFTTKLNE